MLRSTSYDLFVKKLASLPAAETTILPTNLGAAGLDLTLVAAQQLKQRIREQGGVAVVFPAAYRIPTLTSQEAHAVAYRAYQELVQIDPANYGPLELYAETPVYWLFSADNYQLQAEGYSPGRNAFSVDKLTGELLTDSDLKARFSSLQGA